MFCPLPLHTAHIVWVVGGLWAPLDVLHACCAPTIGGLSRFIFSPMWFWLALTDLYSGIWKNRLTRQRRCRRASFLPPSTPPTLWVFTTRLHATKPGMSIEYLHSDFDQKYILFFVLMGFPSSPSFSPHCIFIAAVLSSTTFAFHAHGLSSIFRPVFCCYSPPYQRAVSAD